MGKSKKVLNQEDVLFDGALNKDSGELVLWEKEGGPYTPEDEDGYYTTNLQSHLIKNLFPLAGLIDLLNKFEDEPIPNPSGLCSTIEAIMRDINTNIVIITKYLDETVGKISFKFHCSKFTYTEQFPPAALAIKPTECFKEMMNLVQEETGQKVQGGNP